MSSVSDPPAGKQSGADPSNLAPGATTKQKWEPTAETLQKFLALLSSDYEEAGKVYEKLRTKLIRFFEWRGCASADILADQTFDRVLRKLDQGEIITNPGAYVRKVGYYIFLEVDTSLLKELDEESSTATSDSPEDDSSDNDALFSCFDKCLAELPPESKSLILAYYQDENRSKKDGRRELAEQLNIPMNALRIRAHRIRKILERCIQNCMAP